jgi:hypothetical protein
VTLSGKDVAINNFAFNVELYNSLSEKKLTNKIIPYQSLILFKNKEIYFHPSVFYFSEY